MLSTQNEIIFFNLPLISLKNQMFIKENFLRILVLTKVIDYYGFS